MEINKEFFIFGLPVETDICTVRFLKYFEYIKYLPELSTLTMNVLHIYYQYRKLNITDDPEIEKTLERLKENSLYEIVGDSDQLASAYFQIFNLVIDNEEAVRKIIEDENLFMLYRQLILDMNMLSEEEVSPNPEIQEFIDAGRELAQQNSDKQTYSDIMSSIVIGAGVDYDIITNWTVLRVYATFYRIGAFKNSDVTALFATVTDKVKYETWNKNIDLHENKRSGMKMSEFNKQYGSLFK